MLRFPFGDNFVLTWQDAMISIGTCRYYGEAWGGEVGSKNGAFLIWK